MCAISRGLWLAGQLSLKQNEVGQFSGRGALATQREHLDRAVERPM
jgi:hypothetical protein